MDDNEFRNWAYDMYSRNREERMDYREPPISFDEYFKNNMAWLKLKYKELKGN